MPFISFLSPLLQALSWMAVLVTMTYTDDATALTFFFFFSRSSRSKYGSGFQLLLLAGQTSGISCTVLFPHPPGLHCPLPLAHSPAEHSKMHAFVELQRMYYHKPQLVRDQAQLGIELKWLEIQLSSGSINEQTQTPTNLRFPPFYC